MIRFLASALSLVVLVAGAVLAPAYVAADEFTEEDVAVWQSQYMDVVEEGRAVFTDPALGSNGVVCAQCHPNATNIHPETYPKFQQQLGDVVALWQMINWCIQHPLEGKGLLADDPKMIALQAYIAHERRGVPLDPGKH